MKSKKIGIIGLGYVGLPLAVEFGKKRQTIGYDLNHNRVKELMNGIDSTLETTSKDLSDATYLTYTTNSYDIKDCDIYIVTVPTPIDKFKNPDLSYLENSSREVGSMLNNGDLVIYESTVYPGAT